MTDAVPPVAEASFRAFAHQIRTVGGLDGALDGGPDIAEEFHEASKMRAEFPAQVLGPAGVRLASSHDAHLALGRKALTCAGPATPLPPPIDVATSLLSLARARRSALPSPPGVVPLAGLSTVLAIGAGAVPGRPGLRAVPSAGALYPIDVLVLAYAVDGLGQGLYVYDPLAHALLPRGAVDPSEFHTRVGGSIAPAQPAVTLALVATFARSRAKYGLRGYRFSLLEAGHLAQSLLLAATACDLASLPWGGFIDAAADRLLDLDGLERSCLHLVGLSGRGGAA